MRVQQFLVKISRELTLMCSADTLSAVGQDRNIFSICCSTGEFLLYFLNVILTAIAYHKNLSHIRLPSLTASHAQQYCDAHLSDQCFPERKKLVLPV
jgi:hypothetical protein